MTTSIVCRELRDWFDHAKAHEESGWIETSMTDSGGSMWTNQPCPTRHWGRQPGTGRGSGSWEAAAPNRAEPHHYHHSTTNTPNAHLSSTPARFLFVTQHFQTISLPTSQWYSLNPRQRGIVSSSPVLTHLLRRRQSLRITPAASKPATTPAALGAPSAPGVHDTLRSHMGLTAPSAVATAAAPSSNTAAPEPELQSTHPLEARLAKWRATQDALKMEGLRRNFGMAEPIRRGMELKVVRAGEWRPAQLGNASGVHSDILTGRDAEIDWEDVFQGEPTHTRGTCGFSQACVYK